MRIWLLREVVTKKGEKEDKKVTKSNVDNNKKEK